MPETTKADERVPMTEEEIRASTVGELQPLTRPIQIVDYDPMWPALFQREVGRIREALGKRALSIDHVGSTCVPGLAAKPRIDILLVVADSSDEPSYVPSLEAAGYVLRIREPDWYQHRVFKGPDSDINLHVFSSGCPEIDRMLLFRDHLRRNDADRQRYERTKRELAQQDWKHTQNYADAKTRVVEEIIARAQSQTSNTSSAAPDKRSITEESSIRRATRADVPAIIRLLADDPLGRQREQCQDPLPEAYYQAFARIDADPRNELMVVELRGEVVATLQLTMLSSLSRMGGMRAQIEAVRVDRRYRSRGLGRYLFEWAIERARQQDCHVVQLTTDADRPEAARFYQRLGFVGSHVGMKLHLR